MTSMPGDAHSQLLQAQIPNEYAGQRVDLVLGQLFPQYSRARLQAWIKDGRVRLDDRVPEAKTRVWGGEMAYLEPPSAPAEASGAQDIPLDIVHEDPALLVINKPVGLVVHPGNGVPDGTLMNALLHHDPRSAALPRAGIVHRLDKDTSGLMVIARTEQSYTDLVRQLQARSVTRIYLALAVGNAPESASVTRAIGRHPTHRTRMAVTARGRPAVTHLRTLRHGVRWSLVRCQLETGRTHQIRVHMAELGHPLIGDPTYGSRGKEAALPSAAQCFGRQALHATQLELSHPETGARLSWHRPPPTDFEQLLSELERCDPSA